jgi:endonuclease III-like uncharacterized protein
MTISITHLYSILSEKVGKETAESLTAYIESKIEKVVDNLSKHLASKEDMERGFKEQTRWMLATFITLVLMILGLYETILLKS